MFRKSLVGFLLIYTLNPASAFAGDDIKVKFHAENLPDRISAAKAQSLSALAAKYMEGERRVKLARLKKELEVLGTMNKAVSPPILRELEKLNPGASATLSSKVKGILASKLSAESKYEKGRALYSAYQAKISKAIERARIDEKVYLKHLDALADSDDANRDADSEGECNSDNAWLNFLCLLVKIGEGAENPPPREPQTVQMFPPYADTWVNGSDSSSSSNGFLVATSDSGLASITSSTAGVGQYFDLPSGYSRVRALAKLHVDFFFSTAVAFGGYSTAGLEAQMRVLHGSDHMCSDSRTISRIYGPVLWVATDDGENQDIFLVCEFTPPSTGGTLRISGALEASTAAGGIGGSAMHSQGNVEFFEVSFTP